MKTVLKNSLLVVLLFSAFTSFSKNNSICMDPANSLISIEDTKNKVHKPSIINKEEVVIISKVHFEEKPILVNIYYNNEIIFSEKIKGNSNGVINRAYRLSKSEKGNYSVQINVDNKRYTKEFSL